jgi:NADH-quinone oxidoreductase subunit M
MYQRLIFGPLVHPENRTLTDLTARELAVIVPVIALCVVMGLYPAPFLSRMEPSVTKIVERVQPKAVAETPGTVASR